MKGCFSGATAGRSTSNRARPNPNQPPVATSTVCGPAGQPWTTCAPVVQTTADGLSRSGAAARSGLCKPRLRRRRHPVHPPDRQRRLATLVARPFCRRLGSTLLRDRLLAAEGFTVVSVPFYEWEALTSNQARGAYLQAKLDAAADAAAAGGRRRAG